MCQSPTAQSTPAPNAGERGASRGGTQDGRGQGGASLIRTMRSIAAAASQLGSARRLHATDSSSSLSAFDQNKHLTAISHMGGATQRRRQRKAWLTYFDMTHDDNRSKEGGDDDGGRRRATTKTNYNTRRRPVRTLLLRRGDVDGFEAALTKTTTDGDGRRVKTICLSARDEVSRPSTNNAPNGLAGN